MILNYFIILDTYSTSNKMIKITLVGDIGSGKSTFLYRLLGTELKVGHDFQRIDIGNKTLQLWDTTGQERFETISKLHYKNSNIILVMYDIAKTNTFDNAERWINGIQKYGTNAKVILIGNIICEDRKVTSFAGNRLAQKYNIDFIEIDIVNNNLSDHLKKLIL